MRLEPGFLKDLKNDIKKIDPNKRLDVEQENLLLGKVTNTENYDISDAEIESNGELNIIDLKDTTDEAIKNVGLAAIENGEVAVVVFCDETIDDRPLALEKTKQGISLLTHKFFQHERLNNPIPLWVMTSPLFFENFKQQIVTLIPQPECVVFGGKMFYHLGVDYSIDYKNPSFYTTGTAGLYDSLRASDFFETNKSVKYVVCMNVSNAFGMIDAGILGQHILSESNITCEVVKRNKNDASPSLVCKGFPTLVDSCLLTKNSLDQVKYSFADSMIINVEVLKKPFNSRYLKKRRIIDGKIVIEFNQSITQYTESYVAKFVEIPRELFVSVKTHDDFNKFDELINGNKKR